MKFQYTSFSFLSALHNFLAWLYQEHMGWLLVLTLLTVLIGSQCLSQQSESIFVKVVM